VRQTPVNRYRPTRAADGKGGFVETLGAAAIIFGAVILHRNVTVLAVEIHEDVIPGDIVAISAEDGKTAAQYRVGEIDRQAGQRHKLCALERLARPIEP